MLQHIPNWAKQFNAIFVLLRKTSKIKKKRKYFHLKVLTLKIQLKILLKQKQTLTNETVTSFSTFYFLKVSLGAKLDVSPLFFFFFLNISAFRTALKPFFRKIVSLWGEISFAVKPYFSPDKNAAATKKLVLKKLTRPCANGCGQMVLHHLSIAQLWPLGSLKAKQNERSLQVEYSKTGLYGEQTSRTFLLLSNEV